MDTVATATETVYSGKDYLDSLTKKPETEKLTSTLSGNGLSTKDADKLTASRANNKLFDTTGNQLGKEDFLLLLTTQLKFQDPMDPMSNEDQIAQLAQFTSLENMTNMSKSIEEMNDSFHQSLTLQQESAKALQLATESIDLNIKNQGVGQLSMNNALMAGMIGKDVRVNVDKVVMQYDNGVMPSKTLFFKTDTPADEVIITVKNSKGEIVRTLPASTLDNATQYDSEEYGEHKREWDGLDNNGNAVPPGTYDLSIQAKLGGKAVSARIFEQGTVGGVDYSDNGLELQVKSKDWDNPGKFNVMSIPIGMVMSVREHTETEN
jgi:flagellar basal-body rod modification protein FlgD